MPITTIKYLKKVARHLLELDTKEEWYDFIKFVAYKMPKESSWRKELMKVYKDIPQNIFVYSDTSKLPFVHFGTLPLTTCPGMGTCEDWCYSFKSWQYPHNFAKQLRNIMLLKFAPDKVLEDFMEIPQDSQLRLYTDGDFDSYNTVKFWMQALLKRPDIKAYGYSKSFRALQQYDIVFNGVWPDNYVLNISGGAKEYPAGINKLAIVRGNFTNIPIEYPTRGYKKYDEPLYKLTLRDRAKEEGLTKVFLCPGKCGECTPVGPLCGNKNAKDITVVIGTH